MRVIIAVLFIVISFFNSAGARDKNTNWIKAFEPLVGHTWVVNTQWANGQNFHQEVNYKAELNNRIIRIKTWGVIDPKTGEFGLRNEGIITRDAEKDLIRFWQFDVFGGITEGICLLDDGQISFEYEYKVNDKSVTMRDVWQQKNVNIWNYSVVQMKGTDIEKVFMQAEFNKKKKDQR